MVNASARVQMALKARPVWKVESEDHTGRRNPHLCVTVTVGQPGVAEVGDTVYMICVAPFEKYLTQVYSN